jgi:hypothetical protein
MRVPTARLRAAAQTRDGRKLGIRDGPGSAPAFANASAGK